MDGYERRAFDEAFKEVLAEYEREVAFAPSTGQKAVMIGWRVIGADGNTILESGTPPPNPIRR
jgi:hypothetical protein